jgi:hypothetical protein
MDSKLVEVLSVKDSQGRSDVHQVDDGSMLSTTTNCISAPSPLRLAMNEKQLHMSTCESEVVHRCKHTFKGFRADRL